MTAIVEKINALIADFSAQGVVDLLALILGKIFDFVKSEEEIA